MTTSISKAVLIPRKRLTIVPSFTFVENQGFGEEAYIGQSLTIRLKTHNNDGKKKDYWNLAVAFITKDNSFTPTHLSYLEKMAIAKANEANRFSVENAFQKDLSLPNRWKQCTIRSSSGRWACRCSSN